MVRFKTFLVGSLMSDQQILLDDSFWKFLVSIEELKERKEIVIFCASLSIDEETLESYLSYLNRFKLNLLKDEHYLYPLKDHCQIKMEFSLSEWLALQIAIPTNSTHPMTQYFEQIIHNKIRMAQSAHQQFSLYKKPEKNYEEIVDESQNQKLSSENLMRRIDCDIVARKAMKVRFFNNKECDIFPHRLVYLEGVLCVVGENLTDKTLLYFGIEDISDVFDLSNSYLPNLSQIEVNDFIVNIRLINGKDERLVLKIYNQEGTDLLPMHHYLGNPFVSSSTEGDMIWAATIEMCDDVFHWLYCMRDRVEILDPGHLRKDFAHYCELKKQSSYSKKAS